MNPSEPTSEAPRQARATLAVVFTTILLDFMGFSLLFPVLPLFADRLGASPFEVGLISTSFALTQLLFLPAWGWLSDRIGRRPVILISLAGTVVSYVALALADSMAMVYFARVLGGMSAANIATAQAIVTDTTAPSERARGMGVIGAAFGLGFVVGPFIGGTLATFHERLPFVAVAVVGFINLLVAAWLLPESHRPGDNPPGWDRLVRSLVPMPLRLLAAAHSKRLRTFLYLHFHLFAAFAALESMFTLFLNKRFAVDEAAAGLIFGWIGSWIVFTQGFLIGRLTPVWGEVRLVRIGIALMAIGLVGMPLLPVPELGGLPWGLYVAAAAIALGNGLCIPSFTSLYSKSCAQEQSGELLGQSQSMVVTGRIIGPVWAGTAMTEISTGAPFAIAGFLMAIALAIFLVAHRTLVGDGDQSVEIGPDQ